MSERDSAFWAGLARVRTGAGALITDGEGHVLMVEPTYKDRWEIPGGAVDAGETAVDACRRECLEELGLEIDVGRLLVLEHQTESGERGDSIMFVYDGGILRDGSSIRLPAEELRSFRFVEPDELSQMTSERIARRVRFAFEALTTGQFIEMTNGAPRR